jgi:hypothetical protein
MRDLANQDQAARFRDPAEGGCRRIAAGSHIDSATGPLPSASEVAGQQPLVAPHHREPGVNRRVVLPLEESLGPPRPSANRGQEGRVKQQMERHAHRRPRRHETVARPQPLCVHPLPRIDCRVDMTRGICTVGEQGEIRPVQKLACVGLDEHLVSLLPIALRGGITCAFQERRFGHLMHGASARGAVRGGTRHLLRPESARMKQVSEGLRMCLRRGRHCGRASSSEDPPSPTRTELVGGLRRIFATGLP